MSESGVLSLYSGQIGEAAAFYLECIQGGSAVLLTRWYKRFD